MSASFILARDSSLSDPESNESFSFSLIVFTALLKKLDWSRYLMQGLHASRCIFIKSHSRIVNGRSSDAEIIWTISLHDGKIRRIERLNGLVIF